MRTKQVQNKRYDFCWKTQQPAHPFRVVTHESFCFGAFKTYKRQELGCGPKLTVSENDKDQNNGFIC